MTNLLLCAILLFVFVLAMPVELWHWLKGIFHKREEEEDVEFHFSDCGNSLEEKLWLLTDYSFDLNANFP